MPPALIPREEAARLAALHDLGILESPPDAEFDIIVQTASLVCGVPISLISLVGEHKQWFKAQIGLDAAVRETPRNLAFCAYTILGGNLIEVPDAQHDARFRDNVLVTGAPNIRFYAGMPLQLSGGHRVGTLCVIDREPRCLDDQQRTILCNLAKIAVGALEKQGAQHKQKEFERRLARKRHRMADLVEATNVGTWEWNIPFGQADLNGRYAEILGWTLAELTPFSAEAAFAAVQAEDLPALKKKIDAMLDGQAGSYDHEFRMLHRHGHSVWVRGHGTVVRRTLDGSPEWVFSSVEDISQRKAQEAALSKSEAFLDQTGRLAGVGGFEVDLTTGDIAWSTKTCKTHGVAPGSTPTLADSPAFYGNEGRPIIEAAMACAAAGKGGWDLELPLIQTERHGLWVRSVGSTIFADGKPVRLIGAIQDVTEQVMQRQALLAANERVVLATETAGIGVWEWDPTDDRIVWDDRMYSLYGRARTADVSTTEHWLQTLHPQDRARAAEAARVAVETRRPYDVEFRVVWADGTVRLIHATARTYNDGQGRVTRLLGVSWDVTEARLLDSKRNEQEQELRVVNGELERTARHLVRARDSADRASRAKSRFLAGMSHELRTPLNGILGYAQLLRMDGGGLSNIQAARVDGMLDAGSHLLEMISSVLELSEIETEQFELRPVEVDLRKIAMLSLDLVRPQAEAKGLRLKCRADPDAPRSLVTDQTRLRQIILNLLGNAVKFTDSGQVELRLRAVPNGMALRIEIIDTGLGIKPNQRKRLFQDFERLQADVSGMMESSGLGLALSSRLAALLGGRMGYEDNPGGGSIFWLELPHNFVAITTGVSCPEPSKAPASDQAPAIHAAPDNLVNEASHRLRVLVVDDVAMNRDIACAFLRPAGHETACAGGGQEAVEAVRSGEIDVVLMDVRMPEVDGLEATRRIRLLGGPAGRVPIIGLTAQAFTEQVLACTRAGMDGHLSKPYTPGALRDAVARAAALRQDRLRQDRMNGRGAEPHQTAPTGAELPVLDPQAVASMTEYLTPPLIASYFGTIVARCETMLETLGMSDTGGQYEEDLAEAVHTLAGSAGMFGFARLANSGVLLERALRCRSPDASDLTGSLVAAIGATLDEVRSRPHPRAAAADT